MSTNRNLYPAKPSRSNTRPSLGLAAGATIAGLAAIALVQSVGKNFVPSDRGEKGKSVEAIRDAHEVANDVLILKSGAKYRVTPATEDGDGGRENAAGVVPNGKELVVRMPLISGKSSEIDDNAAGWYGFTKPGTDSAKIHSVEDRAASTVWINKPALETEGYVRSYPRLDSKHTTFTAEVTSTGQVNVDASASFAWSAWHTSNGQIVESTPDQTMKVSSTNMDVANSVLAPAGTYETNK